MIEVNQLLEITGYLGGFLFVVFRFIDSTQTSSQREKSKTLYSNFWIKIDRMKIDELPRRIIKPFVEFETLLVIRLKSFLNSNYIKKVSNWYVIGTLAFMYIGTAVVHFLETYFSIKILPESVSRVPILFIFVGVNIALMLIAASWSFRSSRKTVNSWDYKILFYGLVLLFSLSLTFTALVIGGLVSQNSANILVNGKEFTLIQHNVVLLSNLLFDSLTVFFTLKILRFALVKNRLVIYLACISVDILISALLACGVLLSIDLFTPISFELHEIVRLLIGQGLSTDTAINGGWFWLMHTTFIPTCIYLFLIMASLIGKIIVLPISRLIKRASLVDRPHYLTANFFAFIGGLCLFLNQVFF